MAYYYDSGEEYYLNPDHEAYRKARVQAAQGRDAAMKPAYDTYWAAKAQARAGPRAQFSQAVRAAAMVRDAKNRPHIQKYVNEVARLKAEYEAKTGQKILPEDE